MLATRKMKKITVWALCRRSLFARSRGRMSSIAAPVVPIQDASSVPITMIVVLTPGEPRSEPRTKIPPPIVKRAASRMMKGM